MPEQNLADASRGGRPRGVRLRGRLIKKLRSDRCMTQEFLASTARISRRTVNAVESGKPVSVATARALSRALGVEVWSLLALDDGDPKSSLRADGGPQDGSGPLERD